MKPTGFKTDSTGNQWYKIFGSLAAASSALERLERRGYSGAVNFINGKYRVVLRKDSFMDNPGRKRGNMTKLQRKVRAAKKAADRRVAVALAKYLRQENPGRKIVGAKKTRGKGGRITVVPIFAKNGGRMNPGKQKVYEVYWSPTGQHIATVTASTAKAAKSKAPPPYRKYKGEMYVKEIG